MQHKYLLLAAILLLSVTTVRAQQGIAVNATGNAPDASAMLDVQSTAKGMLVPRMSAVQRTGITMPANGLLVYDTDSTAFFFYSGTAWAKIATGNATGDNLGNHTATQNVKLNNNWLSNDGGNEGIRIDNNGLVGVGTATPGATLDVAGNASIGGLNLVSGPSLAAGYRDTATGYASFAANRDNNAAGNHSAAFGNHSQALSYEEFVIGQYGTSYTPASATGFSAADRLFNVGNGSATTPADAFTILKNGKTGINNNAPAEKLDVKGNIQATTGSVYANNPGNTPNGSSIQLTSPANDPGVMIKRGDGSGGQAQRWDVKVTADSSLTFRNNNASTPMVIRPTGFVGIGTTNPGATLDVAGNGSIGSGNTVSGANSLAVGANNTVSNTRSLAVGLGNTVSTTASFAAGTNNVISGSNSFAIGSSNAVSGNGSFGSGGSNVVTGINSMAIGLNDTSGGYASFATNRENNASGNHAAAFGYHSQAPSYGEFVIGSYSTTYTPGSTVNFNNNDRVFNVGNGTGTAATSDAFTILKNGKTGIGNSAPAEKLDVVGNIKSTDTVKTSKFKMTNGATAGYILTGDAAGNAIWTNPNTIAVSGDNLGNHTATQNLNMNGKFISADGTNSGLLMGSNGQMVDTGTYGGGTALAIAGAGTRMMWVPQRGAFRAGVVDGNQWNNSNIGGYSVAMGVNLTVTGGNAAAFGSTNNVSGAGGFSAGATNTVAGTNATAFGQQSSAGGYAAFAAGLGSVAGGGSSFAGGHQANATGAQSVALGEFVSASGQSSVAIGRKVNANQPGSMLLGDTSATTATSDAANQLKARFKGGYKLYADEAQTVGLQIVPTAGVAKYFSNVASSYDARSLVDKNYVDSNVIAGGHDNLGNHTATQNLNMNGNVISSDGSSNGLAMGDNGQVVDSGAFGTGADLAVTGAGNRMIWLPKKAAFRAGQVDGTQWDNNNIGNYSVAMGQNNIANGPYSTVFGQNNTVSGYGALTAGWVNTVSGAFGVAFGQQNSVSGYASGTIGLVNNVSGGTSFAAGYSASVTGQTSMAMGRYVSSGGDYSLAFGYNANAAHTGSIVMGDTSNIILATDGPNQFKARYQGGYTFYADGTQTNGLRISATTGVAKYFNNVASSYDARSLVDKNYVDSNITVAIAAGHDNLGNHTATQNVLLNNNWLSNDGGNEGIRIDNSGNVGLNTATPIAQSRITIPGSASFTGSDGSFSLGGNRGLVDYASGFLRIGTITGGGAANGGIVFLASNAERMRLLANGNLGINNTAAAEKLDVVGNIKSSDTVKTAKFKMTNGAAAGYVLSSDAAGNAIWASPAGLSGTGDNLGNHTATQNVLLNNNWLSNDGGAEGIRVDNNGKVGIGTATPGASLDVAGTFVSGISNVASGAQSVALNQSNVAAGANSIAAGNLSYVSGNQSIAAGNRDTTTGLAAAALGEDNNAIGDYSFTTGYNNLASGKSSVTMGDNNIANTIRSFAIGQNNMASGWGAGAMGLYNVASGDAAMVLGSSSSAGGIAAVSLGYENTASGAYSVAIGRRANTNGKGGSFVLGDSTTNNTYSDAVNQMKMRFQGGYKLYADAAQANGLQIVPSTGVAKYFNNVAASYDARSLVDKNYVDSNISSRLALNPETDPQVSSVTTNKVPKWNGTTLVDGVMTDDGTNVGIGTTTPGAKLDVAGIMRVTGATAANLELNSPSTPTIYPNGSLTPANQNMEVRSAGGGTLALNFSNPGSIQMAAGGGGVLIGTGASIAAKLDVNGSFKLGSSGTPLSNIIKVNVATGPYTLPGGTYASFTYAATGAALGGTAFASPGAAMTDGLIISYAYVNAANQVTVRIANTTGSSVVMNSPNLYITVIN